MAKDVTNGIRVAVYGSLREGLHNHEYCMKGAQKLGVHTLPSDDGFRMVSLGGFPAVVPAPTDLATDVVVEVYLVDDKILQVLDSLEGHPDWYAREKIATPWKKAWMYVMPDEAGYNDYPEVENGDWLDHYTDQKAS